MAKEKTIAEIYNEARQHFAAISLTAEAKQPLWDFAETLLGRKS